MTYFLLSLSLTMLIFFTAFELERYHRRAKFFRWYAFLRNPKALLSPINAFYRVFFPNPPFLNLNAFPNHLLLENHKMAIQQEIGNLLKMNYQFKDFGDIETYSKNLARFGWKSFFIKCYDKPTLASEKLLPKTTALIKQCPEVKLAMLSILEPGASIKPHFGPSKLCYRYHLCVFCDASEQAFISVGGEKYFWKEGEAVLFDDTYEHFAMNPTDHLRVVLFCDIERKLPFPFHQVNRKLIDIISQLAVIKKLQIAANEAMPSLKKE